MFLDQSFFGPGTTSLLGFKIRTGIRDLKNIFWNKNFLLILLVVNGLDWGLIYGTVGTELV